MTIFNIRYTQSGINVYNYDYNYDHMFIFYTKKEIEKKVRETLDLKFYFYIYFDALLLFNEMLLSCNLYDELKEME